MSPKAKLQIKFKKVSPDAKVPTKAYKTDAGYDLYPVSNKTIIVASQSRAIIPTGVAFEIPDGYFMKIFDRSGLASKNPLVTVAGVVDAGYRDEVKIVLANYSDFPTTIEPNTAIAQFVILPVPDVELSDVGEDELVISDRGVKGFGSSDKKEK